MLKILNKTSSNGVYWANQFDNSINSEAHIQTTAEEIWNQTAGNVDGFTCAVGTGGTLAGVSIGLKNKNKDIKIALSDPMGSALYSHIKNNKLESSVAQSLKELEMEELLKILIKH